MRRRQLFEVIDQEWCPGWLRQGVTDFLQFLSGRGDPYEHAIPRLTRALDETSSEEIVDLGSGTGGPWFQLHEVLVRDAGRAVRLTLTDIRPERAFPESMARKAASLAHLTISTTPVDAARVPAELDGFRTLFSVFHHFPPPAAAAVLADAVRSGRPIAVFEMTHRSLRGLVPMLMTPLAMFFVTPFIRPFSWLRLFFTYVVPLIPLVTAFDGVVSSMRTYSTSELAELVGELDARGYVWEIDEQSCSPPFLPPITYLIGYPRAADAGSEES